jgi:hypothetical protein
LVQLARSQRARRIQVKPGQAAAGCSRNKASDSELRPIAALTLFEISEPYQREI